MNIFYLDNDPRKCAVYHNDKHVVKMILETAQLLCGAHWATGSSGPYLPMGLNHPCGKWVREDLNNYNWLCQLGLHLCWEYKRRYGKTHKTYDVIIWCCDNKPNIPDVKFTQPALAMPDQYKIANNAILSYRNYYINEKSYFSTWKTRRIPSWFK